MGSAAGLLPSIPCSYFTQFLVGDVNGSNGAECEASLPLGNVAQEL